MARLEWAFAPRFLPDGGSCLILGSGPSLTQADVDFARAHVDVTIAVNDAYLLAADAECLYAGDVHWWKWHEGASKPHVHNHRKYPAFTGRYKATIVTMMRSEYADVHSFRPGPQTGLSLKPTVLNRGYNSVYQSVNLAVHFGATRILLLGVDMQQGQRYSNGAMRPSEHFFGSHPAGQHAPYTQCLAAFATLVAPLAKLGVELVNCTPGSALTCFPMMPLRELWPESVAV